MDDDTPQSAPDESPSSSSPLQRESDTSGASTGEIPPLSEPGETIALPVSPLPEPVSARIAQHPETRSSRGALLLLGAFAAAIVGAVVTVATLTTTGALDLLPEAAPVVTTTVTAPTAEPADVPLPVVIQNVGAAINPAAIAEKAIHAIVTVVVADTPRDSGAAPIGIGSGSGVVISSDGYIITNHHVIDGGDTFQIHFQDGRTHLASLVGSDDLTDLAVLKIEASGLTYVEFGTSDALRVGDPAVAIGNPLGQEGGASVTLGILSAFDRRVEFADDTFLHGMIQTDAAINSGSSGGGLFNAEGQIIGITSAIGVSPAGPEGIGYAIPIELVDRIASEIIETGDVAHPFLGVSTATATLETDDGAIVPSGALIASIEGTDSAAGMAGLLPGDIVIEIGGREVTNQTDLILAVRLYRVGERVEFIAMRRGELISFSVVMGQRPAKFGG